ncbi:galactolipase DONGLE, chloroplastic [Mercurialis annua]|uniref:galactolipase DONGLE, chloroplastic n=1 Tax=Mercurialis annua TaxID=3986 RepID=UPI00216083E4|nr:galactolipase DONGLE, chloroplastic [Mercurialis annua]
MASKILIPKLACTSKLPVYLRKKNLIFASTQQQTEKPSFSSSQIISCDDVSTAPLSCSSFTNISRAKSSNLDSLCSLWREIQGCSNWDNLVEPLHPLLRQEIVRYGEFVTACYKAFDLDPNSKRFLSCKYGKKNMLNQIGMHDSGYEVTKYIYATPDINIPIHNGASCSRWVGYMAVSNDKTTEKIGRRDIIITFRGTVTNHEWVANFMSSLTPPRLDPHNPRLDVKVESGFLSLYTSDESDNKFGLESCREQLLSELSRLLKMYKGEEMSISMAGHSMGSSLALLLAYDISELGLNRNDRNGDAVPVTVFSFGGPRVGNAGFKERCEELGVKVLRIVNVNDPITKLPGVFLNENFRVLAGRYKVPWSYSCYAHVGVELLVDFFSMQNPTCVHDLEAYLSSLLMKCPKRPSSLPPLELDHQQENFVDGFQLDGNFLNKTKELLFNAQNLNILPLRIALCNMINLVQSQKTKFLINEHVYLWMNSLLRTAFALFVINLPESQDHILLHCPFATAVWNNILINVSFSSVMPSCVDDFLVQWCSLVLNGSAKKLWHSLWDTTLWEILEK